MICPYCKVTNKVPGFETCRWAECERDHIAVGLQRIQNEAWDRMHPETETEKSDRLWSAEQARRDERGGA